MREGYSSEAAVFRAIRRDISCEVSLAAPLAVSERNQLRHTSESDEPQFDRQKQKEGDKKIREKRVSESERFSEI